VSFFREQLTTAFDACASAGISWIKLSTKLLKPSVVGSSRIVDALTRFEKKDVKAFYSTL
jgi:hypothetical protein